VARHGVVLDLVLILLLVLRPALDAGAGRDVAGDRPAAEQIDGQDGILEGSDRAGSLVAVLDLVIVRVGVVRQVRAGVLVLVVEAVVVAVLLAVLAPVVVGVLVPRVGLLLEFVQVVDLVPVLVLVRLIDLQGEIEPLLPAVRNSVAVPVLGERSTRRAASPPGPRPRK